MKDNFWVEESNSQPTFCKKRKRRVGKRKLEFVGWGSRPVIEFLEAIGQDTSKKHSQQEVASLVRKYINDKGLASAEKKKKKVICDEWLYLLFGKKSMLRTKVFDMLEEHFAENHDDSDDDGELSDSSDEDCGEKKSFELRNFPLGQTKAIKTPRSCFAAIIPENIKLIYLKRSVIQELVKFPESFESKVVGSFVRLKSDPNDIFQKNRFQLLQVTGIHEVAVSDGADIEIYLRLSNFLKDFSISMLSDDNFTEEEVQEVWDRIKAGSLNRLTTNELQLKAQVLHVDITNNWIAKEINLLQKLAEHANEKGWQREKFEYLERRKMLQNPSEREKLLLKVPDVVAEELEPESMLNAASEKADISATSPKSILRGSSDVSSNDASGSGEIGSPSKVISSELHAVQVLGGGVDGVIHIFPEDPKGSGGIGRPPKVISSDLHALQVLDGGVDGVIHFFPKDPKVLALPNTCTVPVCDPSADTLNLETMVANVSCGGGSREGSGEKYFDPRTNVVIELSDDDEVETVGRNCCENPNEAVWHYLDPTGRTQGPFQLSLLKRWSDLEYFPPGFTVWKTGQTPSDGLLLLDVLHRIFQ